jgi:small nuclear ribonucleoprotein (snRNP)-like protein
MKPSEKGSRPLNLMSELLQQAVDVLLTNQKSKSSVLSALHPLLNTLIKLTVAMEEGTSLGSAKNHKLITLFVRC